MRVCPECGYDNYEGTCLLNCLNCSFVFSISRSEIMKMQPVKVVEVEQEGFLALIGQTITVFCAVYIYTGKLVGVNDTCIKLENPKIVYETGAFTEKNWKDAQALTHEMYIQCGMIEAFGIVK